MMTAISLDAVVKTPDGDEEMSKAKVTDKSSPLCPYRSALIPILRLRRIDWMSTVEFMFIMKDPSDIFPYISYA